VVAQSFGGFIAPLVAAQLQARANRPGRRHDPRPRREGPRTGPPIPACGRPLPSSPRGDGGTARQPLTPWSRFYHDVPRAPGRGRPWARGSRTQSDTPGPQARGHSVPGPPIPTRFVLCTEDPLLSRRVSRRPGSRRTAWHRSRPDRRWPTAPRSAAPGNWQAWLAGYAVTPGVTSPTAEYLDIDGRRMYGF